MILCDYACATLCISLKSCFIINDVGYFGANVLIEQLADMSTVLLTYV